REVARRAGGAAGALVECDEQRGEGGRERCTDVRQSVHLGLPQQDHVAGREYVSSVGERRRFVPETDLEPLRPRVDDTRGRSREQRELQAVVAGRRDADEALEAGSAGLTGLEGGALEQVEQRVVQGLDGRLDRTTQGLSRLAPC